MHPIEKCDLVGKAVNIHRRDRDGAPHQELGDPPITVLDPPIYVHDCTNRNVVQAGKAYNVSLLAFITSSILYDSRYLYDCMYPCASPRSLNSPHKA